MSTVRLFVEASVATGSGLAEIEVLPIHTIGEIKAQICEAFGLDPNTVLLMYAGNILDENMTIAQLGIPDSARLALMPYDIIGGK